MTVRCCFLHGINNEGRSEAGIKAAWSRHINAAHGISLSASETIAPYYGDLLDESTDRFSKGIETARTTSTEERERLGISPVRAGLYSSFSGFRIEPINLGAIGKAIIGDILGNSENVAVERILEQAGVYFGDAGLRNHIRQMVVRDLQLSRPDVVIAHSLGSVVAIDALRSVNVNIPSLITIGSPLGSRRIAGLLGGTRQKPRRLGMWYDLRNNNDWVASAGGSAKIWHPVEDHSGVLSSVHNHSVKLYLSQPLVGKILGA